MKFFVLATALASVASAADICRTSARNCRGTTVCCTGIQAGQCCNLGQPVSHILYRLPSHSRGRIWNHPGCRGEVRTFTNRLAGSTCQAAPHGGGRSAKWLRGLSGSDDDVAVEAHHTCAEPDTIYYEGEEGDEESAALPGHLSADEIMEALEEGVNVKTLIIQEIRE